jgi:type III pantothenate kinase
MAVSPDPVLLINNNNTRTKFTLACDGKWLEHRSLASADVTAAAAAALTADWTFDRVVLASVVPALVPALLEAQGNRPVLQISDRIELGLLVDFPDPSKVGADRLANAVAVAHLYPGEASIVVDFGTAVTFDIVDPRPAYLGGVIAPGLDAMRHYLHERTALLPEIELVRPESAVGKSTVHAMQSGAYHGYRGLVREILSQIQAETACRAKVIATGGYAALIAGNMPEIESVDPYLTMTGLWQIALLNSFA